MARIYVSSTFSDLENYRKEVSLALRRLGHEDVAMEYYVAEDRRPLNRCLDDVSSCDVYVGIFAWRHGYVPKFGNPEQYSITELEYRRALDTGKTCLIFLISDDAPWPPAKMELAAISRIQALREELMDSDRHIVSMFANADELTRKVNEAVTRWEKQTGLAGKRESADWYVYREAVFSRHRWVRLQVIAGASKERDPVRIPLTEVFEPQLVAIGASGTDVPDEVRRYQKEIYGMRSHLSNGIPLAAADESEESDDDAAAETEDQFLSGNPEQVLDVLGRERTQVILGGPGSGKSTLLQYAMLRVCEPGAGPVVVPRHLHGEPIPFLVELRSYVLQKDEDFVNHIVRRSSDFYGVPISRDSLNNVLEENEKAIVFFDGLDEVFDPDERRRVIDQFQAFIRRYPGSRILVTSRIAGYDQTGLGLAGFSHYTLMPLTLGHVRNFAEQWYRYYTLEGTERTASGLVQRIVESPRLLDLAGNPLLLTMMAVIYKDRDLPNERWRLYERCAETLLEDWDLSKGIEDEDFKLAVAIRTAQKSEMLQQVSIYMLEHTQAGSELNAISYAPLQEIIASYLQVKYQRPQGEAEAIAVDILRHLMERTYVLAGIGERVFGFVHRTFMEYFAACRCLAQFNARKSDFTWLTRGIFEMHWQMPEWEEVLLLLTAMLHDQGTPIHDVVEHLRLDSSTNLPFNVAFAARCLGEADDIQDQIQGQQLLAELAEAIAEHAPRSRREEVQRFVEAALRSFAALAPVVTAPPVAVHEAITHLNQVNTVATRTAAWQMGFALRSRKERLGYALAALQDTQEAVRRGAIAVLEREWPGRADIGPVLAEVVRTDRHSRVRLGALAAMQRSWRNEPAILDAIADRVDEETAYTIVARLIEYLATTWRGNHKALDLVIKLATSKPNVRADYYHTSVLTTTIHAVAQGWGGEAQGLAFLQDCAVNDPDPATRTTTLQLIAQHWGGDAQVLSFLQDRASMTQTRPHARPRCSSSRNTGAATLRCCPSSRTAPSMTQTRPHARPRCSSSRNTGAATLRCCPSSRTAPSMTQTRPRARPRCSSSRNTGAATLRCWPSSRTAPSMTQTRPRDDTLQLIAQHWGGDAQVLAFLQDRAVNDPDPATLQLIAQHWNGAQVLAFLQDRAVNDPDPATRTTTLQLIAQHWAATLRCCPSSRTAPSMTQTRPRARPRCRPSRNAGGDAQVLAFLQDRAVNDPDPATRRPRCWPSRNAGADAQVLAFFQDRVVNDPDPANRRDALQLIAQRWGGDAQVLAFFQDRAINDPDPANRRDALQLIAQHWRGDAQVLAFLQDRAINDPDPANRRDALQLIAQHWRGDAQVLAFLQDRAINDPELRNDA